VFHRNGILWFTNKQTNFIGRLDPRTGNMDLKRVPTPHAIPYGIVITKSDNPVFCEFGTNKIGTIDPKTRNIPHCEPRYSFERTAHVRLARLGFIGTPIQKTLDSLIPSWDDSVSISLILERESLAAMVVAIAIVLFLSLLRFSLRWYGEKHLLSCSIRIRHRLRDAYQAFLNTAS